MCIETRDLRCMYSGMSKGMKQQKSVKKHCIVIKSYFLSVEYLPSVREALVKEMNDKHEEMKFADLPSAEEAPFGCTKCRKRYKSEKFLRMHMKKSHSLATVGTMPRRLCSQICRPLDDVMPVLGCFSARV